LRISLSPSVTKKYLSRDQREDTIIITTTLRQTFIGTPLSSKGLTGSVSPGGIDVPVFLLFLSTGYLVSTIRPHARTSRLLGFRVDYLTLISTFVIFLIPLLGIPPIHAIDRSISLIIAFTMITLGLRTGQIWGSILLCIPSNDDKPLIKQVPSREIRKLIIDLVYTWCNRCRKAQDVSIDLSIRTSNVYYSSNRRGGNRKDNS